MPLSVTPLYAGLLALLFLILSFRVVQRRHAAEISLGDGDDKNLRKRMRVHANCAEYAPIGLVLLLLCELQGAPLWALHVLGVALVLGRVGHAYGMGATPQVIWMRILSMLLTFTMIGAAALLTLALWLMGGAPS